MIRKKLSLACALICASLFLVGVTPRKSAVQAARFSSEGELKGRFIIAEIDDKEFKNSSRKYYLEHAGKLSEIFPEAGRPLNFRAGSLLTLTEAEGGVGLVKLQSPESKVRYSMELQKESSGKYRIKTDGMSMRGDQRVLIVKTVLNPENPQLTEDEMREWTFGDQKGSARHYYKKVSFNQVSLSGEVIGPFKTDYCLETQTMDLRDFVLSKIRTLPNIDLQDFAHLLIVQDYTCSKKVGGQAWGSFSPLPENPSFQMTLAFSFNNGAVTEWQRVVLHELGHNFGSSHSSRLFCQEFDFLSGCDQAEYKDGYSVMSDGHTDGIKDFNAHQKEVMGWLAGHSQIAQSGEFDLYPIEIAAADGHIQHLKTPLTFTIPSGYHSEDGSFLSLEYRIPTGYDDELRPAVHMRIVQRFGDTYLLSSGGRESVFGPGETYEDKTNGFRISVLSTRGESAKVKIESIPRTRLPGLSSISFTSADRLAGGEDCSIGYLDFKGTSLPSTNLNAVLWHGNSGQGCPDEPLQNGVFQCRLENLDYRKQYVLETQYGPIQYRKIVGPWNCAVYPKLIDFDAHGPGATCGEYSVSAHVSPPKSGEQIIFKFMDQTANVVESQCLAKTNSAGSASCKFSGLKYKTAHFIYAENKGIQVSRYIPAWTCSEGDESVKITAVRFANQVPSLDPADRKCGNIVVEAQTQGGNSDTHVEIEAKDTDGRIAGACFAIPGKEGKASCLLSDLPSGRSYSLTAVFGPARDGFNMNPWSCRTRSVRH